MAKSRPIPRRTAEIELWDVNPVGTADAWRREMLQFWAMMLTRGKRVRAQPHLMVRDAESGSNRSLTTAELAYLLASRIWEKPGNVVPAARRDDLVRWFQDSLVVPGERRGKLGAPAAAGLGIPHYLGLALFNRGATRERFWAAFFYSALDTDLRVGLVTGDRDLAGVLYDEFLTVGASFANGETATPLAWQVNSTELSSRDPEVHLAATALSWDSSDGLGSVVAGLPSSLATSATPARLYDQFLCPGTVILLRRSLRLLLRRADRLGHAALADLVEASLALHAAIYFIRGMHVVNSLMVERTLPTAHEQCWRYQDDLRPGPPDGRESRWLVGGYGGRADASDAHAVSSCAEPSELFVNAGRKELSAAKDVARMSLEQLRRQLSAYTVNRILLSLASQVAHSLAAQLHEPPPGLHEVPARLDRWAATDRTRMALAVLWRAKIEVISTDADVPGAVLDELQDRLTDAGGDPAGLEDVARYVITESILSSRASSRYVELLHSLLGGGALPSNEDPKGIVARGGSRRVPFHLSLNDRALEVLVAVASLEAEEKAEPLSFQGFVDFLASRYGLLVDRHPGGMVVAGGLLADAALQSREALRARLRAMGLLQEFSDSSDWNRVRWGSS